MLQFWRRHRGHFTGLNCWVLDYTCQSFGILLMGLRGVLPDFVCIFGGSLLVHAGAVLLLAGTARFFRQRINLGLHLALLVAVSGAVVLTIQGGDSFAVRLILSSLYLGFVLSNIAWILSCRIESRFRRFARPLVFVMLAFLAVFVVRIVATIAHGQELVMFRTPVWNPLTTLLFIALGVYQTVCLVDMVAMRLAAELTDSIRAQEESEVRYRLMVENAPSGVCIIDENHHIRYANPQFYKMLEKSPEHVLENDFRIMLDETSRNIVDTHYRRRLDGEAAPAQYEATVVTGTGETRSIEIHASRYQNAQGERRVLAQIVDISGRKEAELELARYREHLERIIETRTRQLVRSEKLASIGVLVAGVAHEINNPNNFILMNGEILGKGWGAVSGILKDIPENKRGMVGHLPLAEFAEEARACAAAVISGAERIRHIVLDLRTYARPEAEDTNCMVDLVEVVRGGLRLLEPILRRSTDNFNAEMPTGPLFIHGNFQKLEQVLVNLVQNACQALPDRTRSVRVSLHQDRDTAILTVEDEGCGIPKENLMRITDPFFTTHPTGEGLGLGLSIALRIVQDHGGEMHFNSDGKKGTTATIVLPAGRCDVGKTTPSVSG